MEQTTRQWEQMRFLNGEASNSQSRVRNYVNDQKINATTLFGSDLLSAAYICGTSNTSCISMRFPNAVRNFHLFSHLRQPTQSVSEGVAAQGGVGAEVVHAEDSKLTPTELPFPLSAAPQQHNRRLSVHYLILNVIREREWVEIFL